MSPGKGKPTRPNLPAGREAIMVPGLPAPQAEQTRTEAAAPAEPPPYPGVRGYGRGGRSKKPSPSTRPAPAGMSRTSYYITAEAQAAMDTAVDQVLATLGDDVPKHVALSALIAAGAAQAEQVAAALVSERADALTRRLESLGIKSPYAEH
ncbi:hypothetical protein [Pilimelia anulata]|nr:hypothetical protein [Pilimelia anulata]